MPVKKNKVLSMELRQIYKNIVLYLKFTKKNIVYIMSEKESVLFSV